MWFIQLLIGLAIGVLGYILMPKPKAPKPPAAQDMEAPTASAGRPMPVVFGTVTVKGGNLLYYTEQKTTEYTIQEGGGKGGF